MNEGSTTETKCDCIVCGFRRVLQEKYPGGMTEENQEEVRNKLAGMAGVLLAGMDDEATDLFVNRMIERRERSRARRMMRGGMVIIIDLG